MSNSTDSPPQQAPLPLGPSVGPLPASAPPRLAQLPPSAPPRLAQAPAPTAPALPVLLGSDSDEVFARPTFEVLYGVARAHLPEALRLSRVPREDVDDLVHDVVIAAHRRLDRYVPRVG